MIDVVVVRLKATKGIYYVSPNMLELKIGDLVVFETDNGLQLGEVCKDIYKEKQDNVDLPLQKVVRIAEDSDIKNFEDNVKITDKALKDARKISKELELDMNILDASYTLDRKQLLFNFIADERVDFRELAKKLAASYKTRIELRQIGARDKARTICGIGQCGRPLCCSTFLNHIDSVTMNMAKNQNIALNPSKINGLCGRLLCCLKYEDQQYTEMKKGLVLVTKINPTGCGGYFVFCNDCLW